MANHVVVVNAPIAGNNVAVGRCRSAIALCGFCRCGRLDVGGVHFSRRLLVACSLHDLVLLLLDILHVALVHLDELVFLGAEVWPLFLLFEALMTFFYLLAVIVCGALGAA